MTKEELQRQIQKTMDVILTESDMDLNGPFSFEPTFNPRSLLISEFSEYDDGRALYKATVQVIIEEIEEE